MTRLARWVALVLLALVAGCGGGGGAAPADSVAPDTVIPPDIVTPPDTVTPPETVVLTGERKVNTSSDTLIEPAITGLSGGGFVVTWLSSLNEGALYGQRFDVNGVPVGGETLVRAAVHHATIAGLSDGGYVVGWLGVDIHTQRFDAAGARLGGETPANASAVDPAQKQFGIAGLRDGGYVATWTALDQSIYAQRFDAAGAPAGGETRVNTNTAYPGQWSAVAALTDGGYAVTWTSRNAGGSGGGLYAQRFDRAGVRVGGEALVGTFGILYDNLGDQFHAIAGLAEGGYVVTWTYDHIYAQRVDAAGSPVGDTAIVAATGGNHSQVAALSDGGYVVTWDGVFDASAMTDIAAQRFDRAGARLGDQLWVNSYVPYYQGAPAVAGLADGGYLVTWVNAHRTGGSDIHMQRFDASNLRR